MKRTPIKRRQTKAQRGEDFKAQCIARAKRAEEFKRQVTARGCVMCANEQLGDQLRRDFAADLAKLDAHHIITKRQLKDHGLDEFSPLLWDPANGICLCSYHHQRHHRYVQRLPRRLVPVVALGWATAIGLAWLFDREYPPDTERCDSCGAGEARWTGMSWLCADCEAEFRE